MSTKMRPLRLSANRRWVASFVLCSVCLVLGGSQIGAQSDCDGNGVDDALDLVRDPEADCDGDGVLDVCQLEPEASIGVSPTLPLPLDEGLVIAIADIDGDGDDDLIRSESDHARVVVLENRSGEFRAGEPVIDETDTYAISMGAAGDINGDERVDIVAADPHGSVRIFIQGAGGQFQARTFVGREDTVYRFLVDLVDLDGDDVLDVVLVGRRQSKDLVIVRFLGAGGEVLESIEHDIPSVLSEGIVFDVDGDDVPDFAWLTTDPASFSWIPGVRGGEERFAFGTPRTLAIEGRPLRLAMLDIDLDSSPEAAVALDSGEVILLSRDPSGDFEETGAQLLLPDFSGPRAVVATDLDVDGFVDLVVLGDETPTLAAFRNRSGEGFDDAEIIGVPGDGDRLMVANLSGDEHPDFVADTGLLLLQRPPSAGAFVAFEWPTIFPTADLAGRPWIGDFDNDGATDIVVPIPNRSETVVFRQTGAGTFAAEEARRGEPWDARAIALEDFDNDGIRDVLRASENKIGIAFGSLDGGYLPIRDIDISRISDMAISDVDGDGFLDAVVAGSTGGWISVVRYNGAGQLERAETFLVDGPVRRLHVLDLNGDERVDIAAVVENQHVSSLVVFLQLSAGSFLDPVRYPVDVQAADFADFTGDGFPDLVGVLDSREIFIAENSRGGLFFAPQVIIGGIFPPSLLAADWNGDSRPDVLALEIDKGVLRVLTSLPGGAFRDDGAFQVTAKPWEIFAAELDGDPGLEVVISSNHPKRLAILDGSVPSPSGDCNRNGVFDGCEIAASPSLDCDDNGVLDVCDIAGGGIVDCDGNGVPDFCEIAERDCDGDGVLDACAIGRGMVSDANSNGVPDRCEGIPYRRGDVNDDARLDISDPLIILNHLFLGGPESRCLDAMDVDDSEELSVTDPVRLLVYLFEGRADPPAAPFSPSGACGFPPDLGTPEFLGCEEYASCDVGSEQAK